MASQIKWKFSDQLNKTFPFDIRNKNRLILKFSIYVGNFWKPVKGKKFQNYQTRQF